MVRIIHSFVLLALLLGSLACDIPKCEDGSMPLNYKEIGDYCNGGGKLDDPPPPTCLNDPPKEPTPTTTSKPSSTGNYAIYYRKCTDVQRMDGKPVDPTDAVVASDDCNPVCEKEVEAAKAAGESYGVMCQIGKDFIPDGELKRVLGDCICNPGDAMAVAEFFLNLFLAALPAIGEIIKHVWLTAFEIVATLPLNFVVPGGSVGTAISGAIGAAKLCEYTYDAATGFKAFFNWAKGIEGLDKNMDKLKDIYKWSKDQKGDWKPPQGLKEGSGKDGDKGAPKDWDKTDPKKDPPKEDPPKENPPKCKKGEKCDDDTPPKEDPPKCKKGEDCDEDTSCEIQARAAKKPNKKCTKQPTKKMVTKTIVDPKSIAVESVAAVDCDVVGYTQACYHYYYAMQEGMGSKFTCSDMHEGYDRKLLPATKIWSQEHNDGWRSYTASSYTFQGTKRENAQKSVACDRDEWPPAYFYNPKQHKGQLVRWVPAEENRGVAQKWTSWCKKNDGGGGNGQYIGKDGALNKKLVNPVKKLGERQLKGTKYETWQVKYTRAVFSMTFPAKDWANAGMKEEPAAKNDFGLRENPCWPEAIAPNDPGFVVNGDDPYYKKYKKGDNPDMRAEYKKAPDDKRVKAAQQFVQKQGGKAPPTSTALPGKSKPPRAIKDRSLELSEDGTLLLRDLEANSTRPLTLDEIQNHVEYIDCADRKCTHERRDLGDADANIVIEGKAPEMSPPEHVDAVPTEVPMPSERENQKRDPNYLTGTPGFERRAVSPELPVVTPSPGLVKAVGF